MGHLVNLRAALRCFNAPLLDWVRGEANDCLERAELHRWRKFHHRYGSDILYGDHGHNFEHAGPGQKSHRDPLPDRLVCDRFNLNNSSRQAHYQPENGEQELASARKDDPAFSNFQIHSPGQNNEDDENAAYLQRQLKNQRQGRRSCQAERERQTNDWVSVGHSVY